MASGATVTIKGGPELRRALKAAEADLRDLSALHRSIASDVAKAVASDAPHDTGRLAGSFRPSGTRTTAKVRSSLVYAPVQNYGWAEHNIEGRHFAESALASSTSGIVAKYRAGVEKLLRKAEG
jgi:hypothetical protein